MSLPIRAIIKETFYLKMHELVIGLQEINFSLFDVSVK